MDRIFKLISAERLAQDAQWGDQSQGGDTSGDWMATISEGAGRVGTAVLNGDAEDTSELRCRLVQLAAWSVAWLEALDVPAESRRIGF